MAQRCRRVVLGASWAAIAAALVVASLSQAAVARPDMFRWSTRHYSVETDVSAGFAKVIGDHMEEIFREYSRRFQQYGEMTARFDIVVFQHERDYLDVVPKDARGSTGVFISNKRLLAAHTERRTAEDVLRTLYHEGFHQFMFYVISQQCPIWLNEGLAEYFSEATWNGQGFTTGEVPGARLSILREAINSGRYMTLAELFALSGDQWKQGAQADSRRAGLQYCEAWSVVHFLAHADGGRHADALNGLLKQISTGRNQAEASKAAFGADLATFEKAWAQYVMSLSPSPKFVCRDNMEALLLLAKMIYQDPRRFTSVDALRREVTQRRRYRWTIVTRSGQRIESDDGQAVAALFRCPTDAEQNRLSYLLLRDNSAELPMLVCNVHPGFIIKAYYAPTPGGDLQPVVEEEVRETVSDGLREAIRAAAR
jgi:hypothetical protein